MTMKPVVRRVAISAVAALGLSAASLQAQAAGTTEKREAADAGASPRPADAKARPTTKYCLIEEMTGSRIGKKTCRTKAEWKTLGIEVPSK